MKRLAIGALVVFAFVASARAQISPDAIRRVVRSHIVEVRDCYERDLTRGGAASNQRLVLSFTIGPSGAVQAVHFDAPTELQRCIAKHVMRWRFPPVPGGGTVRISYPFNFQSAP